MVERRKPPSRYQFEPPVTPVGWKADELRYAVRVKNLFEELYMKYGDLTERVKKIEKEVASNGD